MSGSGPLYKTQTVTAATPAVLAPAGAIRLMKIVVYSVTDVLKVEFKDGITDTGTVLLTVQGGDDTASQEYSFVDIGGIAFGTGCWVKPVGTGGIVYCWYE